MPIALAFMVWHEVKFENRESGIAGESKSGIGGASENGQIPGDSGIPSGVRI